MYLFWKKKDRNDKRPISFQALCRSEGNEMDAQRKQWF